jgi:hypothetical protein
MGMEASMPKNDPPDRLLFVYDADHGLGAMLLDAAKKLVGREDCPLCEITYGPLGKRRAWSACASRLGVPVTELHRDQLPGAWGIQRESLPCVLAQRKDAPPRVVLSREEIVACHGDPEALGAKLGAALDGSRGR